MTHVELSIEAGKPGSIKVDGIDLSNHVSRDIRVEVDEDFLQPARVHVVILAHSLDADIPDALLSAIEGEAE